MADVTYKSNTVNFIRELECDRCAAEIMVFLSQDAESDFSGRQIAEAVRFPPLDVIRSIGFLLNQRLLVARLKNDTLFYSLTADRSVLREVSRLAGLGDTGWQTLLQSVPRGRLTRSNASGGAYSYVRN